MNLPHLPHEPASEGDWFEALMNLCRYLRGPDGCPWDREQTSTDFARHSIGETEELLEALQGTDNAHAEEEFGDTLFVMLAAGAAAEAEGRFNVQRALERAHEKMIRRHDHVFGENKAATPEDAIAAWNRIKQQERENA
ncbi:MAG: MazG nucleotide pyrophosphohydrolase domain-containing protein [Candidatus Hydrogenedentales bacterium]